MSLRLNFYIYAHAGKNVSLKTSVIACFLQQSPLCWLASCCSFTPDFSATTFKWLVYVTVNGSPIKDLLFVAPLQVFFFFLLLADLWPLNQAIWGQAGNMLLLESNYRPTAYRTIVTKPGFISFSSPSSSSLLWAMTGHMLNHLPRWAWKEKQPVVYYELVCG